MRYFIDKRPHLSAANRAVPFGASSFISTTAIRAPLLNKLNTIGVPRRWHRLLLL